MRRFKGYSNNRAQTKAAGRENAWGDRSVVYWSLWMPWISSSTQSLLERALSVRKKSQGGYKMALFGAEIRRRLMNLIDEVEAEIGQYAFAIAEDTGAMDINPKLIDRLRKEADCGVLEPAFELAFPAPAS